MRHGCRFTCIFCACAGNELERALRKIGREDVIRKCMYNIEDVTDEVERAVAKVHIDQAGEWTSTCSLHMRIVAAVCSGQRLHIGPVPWWCACAVGGFVRFSLGYVVRKSRSSYSPVGTLRPTNGRNACFNWSR